jgi:hypothetical protein
MKQFSLQLLLLLFLGTSTQAQTALESGDIAYGARNFKQAISYYERATNEGQNDLSTQLKLAHSYRFVNDMLNAEKMYASACQDPSTDPINFYYYGSVLKANQKYAASKMAFDRFADKHPILGQMAQASCDFALQLAQQPALFTVQAEIGISSPIYDDYAPVLHQGSLVFTSARQTKHDALPGGFSNPSTQNFLYRAAITDDGSLSNPVVIKNDEAVMPTTNIAPFAITSSENFAVSTYNEFSNGIRHTHSASLNRLSMEMHLRMEKIEDFVPGDEFPHILQKSASFPAFANQGQSIYFAMYGYEGGYGGFDLWVIHQKEGKWSKPINLGEDVNTPGDEICPNLDQNGRLYFSSDFHKGLGGYDIFTAQNVAGRWQEIRNLGNSVNSSFDDLYYVYDAPKKQAYFSSNRNKYYNIYSGVFRGDFESLPLVKEATIPSLAAIADAPKATDVAPELLPATAPLVAATELPTDNKSVVLTEKNVPTKQDAVLVQTTVEPSLNTASIAANTNVSAPLEQKPTTTAVGLPATSRVTASADQALFAARGLPDTLRKPTVGNGSTVPCAMNFYIGGIIDAATNRPVSGAFVYIKNLKTGKENKIKDPTNQYGEYSVILNPLSDYTLAVSKAGFKNLVFDVHTGTGGKKTLLGTRAMMAAATLARDKYNNIIEPAAPQINSLPTEEELKNPLVSSSKKFAYESNGVPVPEKGYMIQLIVAENLSKEEQLRIGQYGYIHKEPRGNKTAWRVGVYIDLEHLERNLQELKQQYADAFKVAVVLDNKHLGGRIALSSQVIYPITPLAIPVLKDSTAADSQNSSATAPEGTTARGITATETALIAFKIQLGAYQQAEEISFSKLNHLGTIEKEKKANGLTYFYLASYSSLDDARKARTLALEEGIIAPFVVAFKNGLQVNLSEVLQNK